MTDEMRHVVCMGFAKCGTTLLDEIFRRSSLVATPIEGKEIKFFHPANFPERDAYLHYLGRFGISERCLMTRYTFEASPPYCHQPLEKFRSILHNIKKTLTSPRAVLCFRHPVVRAYSHYVHNLHTFALYGEGVFSPRHDLLRKGCDMSFEVALEATMRLKTRYAPYLEMAYEELGSENVHLFFLEDDATALDGWIERVFGNAVSGALKEFTESSPRIFVRRPIPNYVVEGTDLIAFGSNAGEYVRYENVSGKLLAKALSSRDRWTMELSSMEIQEIAARHFTDDLKACYAISGDARFVDYLSSHCEPEYCERTSPEVLETLHGRPRPGSPVV